MTINEAIEQITTWQIGKGNPSYDELNKALDLGIEALKREQIRRRPPGVAPFGLLQGETKE